MPARELADRARLFSALERAHGLRFVAREREAVHGLDAVIVFPPMEPPAGLPVPCLAFSSHASLPLARGGREGVGHEGVAQSATVRFADHEALDRRLRRHSLVERHAPVRGGVGQVSGDCVLASCADWPAWVKRGSAQLVASAPDELEPGEALRSRLRTGRFLEMLPLIHFLRQLQGGRPWDQPSLRACLVFDDPNLHSTGYGHLRYAELAAHARRHGYHAAVASIPLDYRFLNPAAATLFRQNRAQLSLAVHGNNHERMELLRTDDYDAAIALAAQALRRTARFESRLGLPVCRVMCAPHEVCSDVMMRAMSRLGFEALTLEPLLSDPPESSWEASLDGFECARIGAGGLPVIPRYPLGADVDDLVLRAFLNLPLVVYGHHQDVEDGLDAVLGVVERIRALGPVSWLPLSEIARSNHVSWQNGSELRVRLYSVRTSSLCVPDGVQQLSVELPPVSSGPAEELLLWFDGSTVSMEAERDGPTQVVLPIGEARTVRIEVVSTRRKRFEDVAPPATRLWPVLRRATTEVRDRAAPLRHRIGRAFRTRG